MYISLSIQYSDIHIQRETLYNVSIDYADSSINGIFMGSEIILANLSDYGIRLDNRYNGYEVVYTDTELIIKIKKKN